VDAQPAHPYISPLIKPSAPEFESKKARFGTHRKVNFIAPALLLTSLYMAHARADHAAERAQTAKQFPLLKKPGGSRFFLFMLFAFYDTPSQREREREHPCAAAFNY